MGGAFIEFVVLMAIIFLGSLISLLYFIFRRKSFIGALISVIPLLFVMSFLFGNELDGLTHSKKDVISDLKLAEITLSDDFEIIENDVRGFPERFQKTRIKISTTDKSRLVREITGQLDYHASGSSHLLWNEMVSGKRRNEIVTANYSHHRNIIRESYYIEADFVPTLTIVRLLDETEILEYERIEK